MPPRRRDDKGRHRDPWERPWGEGRGRHRGPRGRHAPWPEPGAPPEEVAERFATAVEDVATKVGAALERAFDDGTEDGARRRQKVGEVGDRVATAVEQAIGKVGEALPRPDPLKEHKKLLRRRDQANNQIVLFAFLWTAISFAVLWGGGVQALPAVVVLAAVFGALVIRNVMWKRSHRAQIGRAEQEIGGEPVAEQPPAEAGQAEPEGAAAAEPDGAAEASPGEAGAPAPGVPDDDLMEKLHTRQSTVSEFVGAVDRQALQVLEALKELGEDRPDIRGSVEQTVAKCKELDARRAKLEMLLEDPDLADLEDRIADLEVRIEETVDEQTRAVYHDTLRQLRSQSESLADVRVMIERLDAYINSSLQSLRTIHIDLLRLQTGDLEDPNRALEEISARASNLNIETKSVREVVEEVDRARRAAGRGAQRQL